MLTRITTTALLCLAVAGVTARPVTAGIVDTPLPALVLGEAVIHVYTVVGVRNGTTLSTVFDCASTSKVKSVVVGIEVFQFEGTLQNDVTSPSNKGVMTLLIGDTRTIVTSSTLAFGATNNINLGNTGVDGAARILASSRKILCTARVVDKGNVLPTSMVQLPVFKKIRQKGD